MPVSLIRQLFLFALVVVTLPASATRPLPFTYQVEKLAEGLSHPWALAELPDGRLLITERTGSIRIYAQGSLSEPVSGLPNDIHVKGQGGLQDVVLHPDYDKNGWIYLSYAKGTAGQNALSLIRVRLAGNALTDLETVYTITPWKDTPVHYGARMLFLPDNTLLVTTGDGFDYREDAQRKDSQLGKILRLNDDGSLPSDNPFLAEQSEQASKYVYSLGHRNPQGIVYHPGLGQVFAHEHGPAGGDEINVVSAGLNYGWPVITNGRDYSGASISPFKTYPGMQQPFWDWTPSIAPSGMAVYVGEQFPDLQGDLLVGALKDRDVKWVSLENGQVNEHTSLFSELNARVREVRVLSDGAIYLLSDEAEGVLYRISAD